MIKAVIFDFDGVIVDSEPLRYKTYEKLFLDNFNIKLEDDRLKVFGRKQKDNIRFFLDKYNLEGDVEDLIKKREKLLSEMEIPHLVEGLKDFLEELKEKSISFCIASSSSKWYIEKILDHYNLSDYFKIIIAGDDVKNGKPDPEIFLTASKKLEVDPENCYVFEDAINGIEAAKKAGMFCVALTTSLGEEHLGSADIIIKDYIEFHIT